MLRVLIEVAESITFLSETWSGKLATPLLLAAALFVTYVLLALGYRTSWRVRWTRIIVWWCSLLLFGIRVLFLNFILSATKASSIENTEISYSRMGMICALLLQIFIAFTGVLISASLSVRWMIGIGHIVALGIDTIVTVVLDQTLHCIYRELCTSTLTNQFEKFTITIMWAVFLEIWLMFLLGYTMLVSGFLKDKYPLDSNPYKELLLRRGADIVALHRDNNEEEES